MSETVEWIYPAHAKGFKREHRVPCQCEACSPRPRRKTGADFRRERDTVAARLSNAEAHIRALLDNAENCELDDTYHAPTIGTCPWCCARINARDKEAHESDCEGQDARRFLEGTK